MTRLTTGRKLPMLLAANSANCDVTLARPSKRFPFAVPLEPKGRDDAENPRRLGAHSETVSRPRACAEIRKSRLGAPELAKTARDSPAESAVAYKRFWLASVRRAPM